MFNKLKQSYETFETLKGNSHFGWNEEDKVVTALEELWAEYIKAHPEVRQFKDCTWKFYSEMRKVFDNTVATGELATATGMRTQKRQHSVYTIECSSSDADPDVEVSSPNSFSLTSIDPPSPIVHRPQGKKPIPIEHSPSPPIQTLYQAWKKRPRVSPTHVSIQAIAGSIESLATSIQETRQKFEPPSSSSTSGTVGPLASSIAVPHGENHLGLPVPTAPMDPAVLVLKKMLEEGDITINEHREALVILQENPIEVSIFAFGIPIMQTDWIERHVRHLCI
ncbi:hypothetical protein C7212DRAFT_341172 [Tuber magnatum]|uniref:Myb/SANT-like domain-containing protein n=1 Tax=Tuber magnatum TaxID=42249 RepID=A0A317T016_9PEZI|nr:hypothetical protein C7212DRAFT_341172 [Tuber magnatum]